MQCFQVDVNDCDLKLRDFLKLRFPSYSNKKLKSMIEQGLALLNKKIECHYSRRLVIGDVVEFKQEQESQKLRIIYEDSDCIVIDKPSNFVCNEKAFRLFLHQKLFLVHRLDKGTSGVMVLAKTLLMKKHLDELFYSRRVQKTYWAITSYLNCPNEICVEKPLKIDQIGNKKIVSTCKSGLFAKTYVVTLESGLKNSLVQCRPVTGKTHQIRVHLQSLNACILGDLQYQKKVKGFEIVSSLMLHAKSLAFTLLDGTDRAFASFPHRNFIDFLDKKDISYKNYL